MPQIINDSPGIGALLGTGLGQGISSGLQQLAQLKTNQLLAGHQRGQTAKGFEAAGIPKDEAWALAGFSPELQSLVFKNYLSAAQSAGLDQALQGVQVNPESQSGISGMQELSAPVQQNQQQQQSPIQQLLGMRQHNVLNKQLPTEKVFADLMAGRQPQAPQAQIPTQQQAPQANAPQQKQAASAPNKLAEILLRPRLTPEHRLKVEALKQQKELAQQKLSAKEQEAVNKETKPVYDAIQKEAKAAKESDMRLDRMEHLIEKGDLSTPAWSSIIKTLGHGVFGLGLDLSAALTADSQEFDKLSTDFLKGAKDIFGGRVTNDEVKAFLRTVPSLTQSKEGKKRVIRNLRIFNKGKLARKKASDSILKAYGGKRPRDYEQLVEEATEGQLDKLAAEFKNASSGPEQHAGLFIE